MTRVLMVYNDTWSDSWSCLFGGKIYEKVDLDDMLNLIVDTNPRFFEDYYLPIGDNHGEEYDDLQDLMACIEFYDEDQDVLEFSTIIKVFGEEFGLSSILDDMVEAIEDWNGVIPEKYENSSEFSGLNRLAELNIKSSFEQLTELELDEQQKLRDTYSNVVYKR